MMEAILLAGGLGTRLRSVVSDRPKPMALIGDRPFMEYVVWELARHGIRRIIFAVGYKGSMVEEYFGDGSRIRIPAVEDGAGSAEGTVLAEEVVPAEGAVPGGKAAAPLTVSVAYAYEKELLGTAGAIKNAGRLVTGDEFFVLNADTFYRLDYSRLARIKAEEELDMALVLRQVPDVSRYGQAVLEKGRLTAFNEKTTQARPGTINGGVYLMNRRLLEEIPPGKVSLENEMIPRWLKEGKRLGGFVNDGYFIDIGVPEDYYRFIADVEKGVVAW